MKSTACSGRGHGLARWPGVGTPVGSGLLMSSSRPDFLKLSVNLWLMRAGSAPPSLQRGSTGGSALAVSGVEESVGPSLIVGVETAVSISKAHNLVGPMLLSGASLRFRVHTGAPSVLSKRCPHAHRNCDASSPGQRVQ